MTLKNVIKLWKKLKIRECILTFDCGGDSMGNTDFIFTDVNDKEVESEELTGFFNESIYNKVEFYVNSDGHYQGESGTVTITYNEEQKDFDYDKSSQSEWTEQSVNIIEVELTDEMVNFIKENISNINGGSDGGIIVNYKKDLILSDADEKLVEELENLIETKTSEYEPDDVPEIDEWYTFTTNNPDSSLEELTLEGNNLKIEITNSYTEFKD